MEVENSSIPVWERQALQDFTLAGNRAQLAALVHGGHAKAAVALHAAPHQQPIPWLKNVQLHLLPCMRDACAAEREAGGQLENAVRSGKIRATINNGQAMYAEHDPMQK